MTQFICECCGKAFDIDEMIILPCESGNSLHICRKCDKETNKGLRLAVCIRCEKVKNETELVDVYDCEHDRTDKMCKECVDAVFSPSENTCVCCGEIIPEGRHVCVKCEGVAITLPPMTLDEKKDAPVDTGTLKHPFDIHKIIDDAMEKRDRTVSIFIRDGDAHITINPYEDEKVYWIYHEGTDKYSFECSNCGIDSEFQTAYCPSCGEQMHGLKRHVDMTAILKNVYGMEASGNEDKT